MKIASFTSDFDLRFVSTLSPNLSILSPFHRVPARAKMCA